MKETLIIYLGLAILLFALGLRGTLLSRTTIDRLLAINIMGGGVFLMLIAVAYRDVAGPAGAPDPVPHALVLTGIVVAVSATALGLALSRAIGHRAGEQAQGAGSEQDVTHER